MITRFVVKLNKSFFALGCAFIVGAMVAAVPAAAQQKPNVVFILADNVGYGDLGSTAAASCAARRHRASTSSPAKVCA